MGLVIQMDSNRYGRDGEGTNKDNMEYTGSFIQDEDNTADASGAGFTTQTKNPPSAGHRAKACLWAPKRTMTMSHDLGHASTSTSANALSSIESQFTRSIWRSLAGLGYSLLGFTQSWKTIQSLRLYRGWTYSRQASAKCITTPKSAPTTLDGKMIQLSSQDQG